MIRQTFRLIVFSTAALLVSFPVHPAAHSSTRVATGHVTDSRTGSPAAIQLAADVRRINAGPIWNTTDAQRKCPATCSDAQMQWNGDWRTIGSTSECDCTGGPARKPEHRNSYRSRHSSPRGNYCEAESDHQCKGCSISCPDDKAAYCRKGDRGIFTGPRDRICSKEAVCECR